MNGEYVSISVVIPQESKDNFSKMVIANGFKQQHFLANLIVWVSMDEERIKLAHWWYRKVNRRGQPYVACVSTPRLRSSERENFKSVVNSIGYKQREILIGAVEMVLSKDRLVHRIAHFRDDFYKKEL
jgi:hypothetical protein